MAYATIARALILYGAEYITVSFDRDLDGVIDTTDVEHWLDLNSAVCDSYLAGKVSVALPLTTVPLDLEMRVVDMTVYRMCPDAARLTDEKTERFKEAMEWLDLVAKGKIALTDYGVSGTKVSGTHLTQRARIVPALDVYAEQVEAGRYFPGDRSRRVL